VRLIWRGRSGFEILPADPRFVGPQDRFGLDGVLGIFQGQGEQAAQGVAAAHRKGQQLSRRAA